MLKLRSRFFLSDTARFGQNDCRSTRDCFSARAVFIKLSKTLAETKRGFGRPRAIDAFQHLLSALQGEDWESMKCCHNAVRLTALGCHHTVKQIAIVTLAVHCFLVLQRIVTRWVQ